MLLSFINYVRVKQRLTTKLGENHSEMTCD